MDFTVGIPPGEDDYVADIFWHQMQWAELRWDGDQLRLTVFAQHNGVPWELPYSEALDVLKRAENRMRQLASGTARVPNRG